MQQQSNSVIFIKLYLITKHQFIDILKVHYNTSISQEEEMENIFNIDNTYNLSFNNSSMIYNQIRNVGELDNINIFTVSHQNSDSNFEIGCPDKKELKNIFIGLKSSFNPYSQYLIMYYVYRIEGVKNNYNIEQLKSTFFTNNKIKNNKEIKPDTFTTINSNNSNNSNSSFSDNNLYCEKIIQNNFNNNIEINNNNNNNNNNNFDNCETIKCSTCNHSNIMNTPEKVQINQYNYIFDLHHLPVFDENTGEFLWCNSNNTSDNVTKIKESIFKSEEFHNIFIDHSHCNNNNNDNNTNENIEDKSVNSINHGSLISFANNFSILNNNSNNNDNNNNELENISSNAENIFKNTTQQEDKWRNYKLKQDKTGGTFVEEINLLLKNLEEL